MLSSQEEQAERKSVMLNDARLKEQQRGSTFLAQTHNDVGGRYGAAQPSPYVIGSTPTPIYPQASAPFQHDPVGLEPPLGPDPADPEPFHSPVQATGPTQSDRARVGPSSDTDGPAPEGPIPSHSGKHGHAAGPSHPFRRF